MLVPQTRTYSVEISGEVEQINGLEELCDLFFVCGALDTSGLVGRIPASYGGGEETKVPLQQNDPVCREFLRGMLYGLDDQARLPLLQLWSEWRQGIPLHDEHGYKLTASMNNTSSSGLQFYYRTVDVDGQQKFKMQRYGIGYSGDVDLQSTF